MLFRCAPLAPATDHGHAAKVNNGKKHFTVDIHCHIHVPEADALLNELAPPDSSATAVDSGDFECAAGGRHRQGWLDRQCR